MTRPVESITLYGFIGSGNFGNDATFETVLTWISANFPTVALRCATIAPEAVTERYGIPAVRLAWTPRIAESRRLMAKAAKVLGRVVDVPRSFRLAAWSDATVVPGMGVLESTLGGQPWGMPLWLFLMALCCRLRKRRFILLDVGADRSFNKVTRLLNLATVRLAFHASFRDRDSAGAMLPALNDSPVVVPDLVYAYPRPAEQLPESGRLVVGVMAYYGPADDPITGSAVRSAYVRSLSQALIVLAETFPQIVLLGGDRVDLDVAREVKAQVLARLPNDTTIFVSVAEISTFANLSHEMARADVIIASRYHNLICGLRLGRPCVSVGYAAKCRDLMHEVGLSEYCQDIGQLDSTTLIDQVLSARQLSTGLKRELAAASTRFAGEVEDFLNSTVQDALGLSSRQVRLESS